jgi:hypothetical protein
LPHFRKLEPEEVKAYENKGIGTRKRTEQLYDSILSDYEVGDYGEATLDAGDNRLTVRNRLKAAATRRGIGINFRRTNGDLLRFQVIEHSNGSGTVAAAAPSEPPAVVSSEPPAPPKKKGGRPKSHRSSRRKCSPDGIIRLFTGELYEYSHHRRYAPWY